MRNSSCGTILLLSLFSGTAACGSGPEEPASSQTGEAVTGTVASNYSCVGSDGEHPELQISADGQHVMFIDYAMAYSVDFSATSPGSTTFSDGTGDDLDLGSGALLQGAASASMDWNTPQFNWHVHYDCVRQQTQASTIDNISATYGDNRVYEGSSCTIGNATSSVAAACSGKTSCQYTVSWSTLGDCSPNYAKDFYVTYTCGAVAKSAYLPAEAGFGSVADLSCP